MDDDMHADAQEERKKAIQHCVLSLAHACNCRRVNCIQYNCHKMRRVLYHTKVCKRKTRGDCAICKQLIALCCFHAKFCEGKKCSVPFCTSIKKKLLQQRQRELQEQLRQVRF